MRPTGADVRTTPPAPVIASARGGDQLGEPAARRGEDRTRRPRCPSRCRRAGRAGAEQEAALRDGDVVQLWHLAEAEPVGVGGVDAADERVDEAFLHLVAEPGADEPPDRVVVDGRPGKERLERGAGLAPPGEQPGRGERSDVGRARRAGGRRGSGADASYQTAACTGSGDTSSSARPTSAASSVASGTRARKASAPLSIMSSPAKAVPPMRPPGRSAVSNTRDVERCGARRTPTPRRGRRSPRRSRRPGRASSTGLRLISATSITRAASEAITSGSALTLAVRSKASPAGAARSAASMSRSYSTSR